MAKPTSETQPQTIEAFFTFDADTLDRKISEINAWKRTARDNGYTELTAFLDTLPDLIRAMRRDSDRIDKLQTAGIVKCKDSDLRCYIDSIEPAPAATAPLTAAATASKTPKKQRY